MCPTSNVNTGAAASYEDHPIRLLMGLRFRVTVNTDNRLMSDVTLTDEFMHLERTFAIGLERMQWLTINAMKSAFLHFEDRLAIIDDVIKPGYAALFAEHGMAS
jgi:adenosine deaminase